MEYQQLSKLVEIMIPPHPQKNLTITQLNAIYAFQVRALLLIKCFNLNADFESDIAAKKIHYRSIILYYHALY